MLMMLFFLTSFILAYVLTYKVKILALKNNLIDVPDSDRKIHNTAKPLLGGLAIFLSFSLVILLAAKIVPLALTKGVSDISIFALVLGGLIIMIGGYLDDKYKLPAWQQLIAPILAVLVVMMCGVKVSVITNPLGGLVDLTFWQINLGGWGSLAIISMLVTFLWLLGMIYTTKLLDGLDGLASGVGLIGSLIIFALTQFTPFYQPSVGLLAIIMAGAILGFLIWNWHPAKIFLGEGGSLYIGFVLGVLSIISGSKIATTLLVMGIPILDVAWVIIRRLILNKKSLAAADKQHLHHRLLDVGFSHKQAVIFLYVLTGSFGLTALFIGSRGKLITLSILLLVMVVLGWWLVSRYKKISQ